MANDITKVPPPPEAVEAILAAVLAEMKSKGIKGAHDEQLEDRYKNYDKLLERMAGPAPPTLDDQLEAERRKALAAHPVGLAAWGAGFAAVRSQGPQAGLGHAMKAMGENDAERFRKTVNLSAPETGGVMVQGDRVDSFFRPLRESLPLLSAGGGPVIRRIVNGSVQVTGLSTDVVATWVGAPPQTGTAESEPVWDAAQNVGKWLKVHVPVGIDAFNSDASATIMGDIEDSIRFGMGRELQNEMISGTGAGFGIRGFRNLHDAAATSASAGATFTNVVADWLTMVNYWSGANADPENLVWIMAPRSRNNLYAKLDGSGDKMPFREEIQNGTWMGAPIAATSLVPINISGANSVVVGVDYASILLGQGNQISTEVVRHTAYTDAGSTLVSTTDRGEYLVVAMAEWLMVAPQPERIYELTSVNW